MASNGSDTTEDEIGRVVQEWFSLPTYNWKDRKRERPRVSRKHDKDFFDLLWDHPEWEEYFEVVD